ncbi:MAG: hypothetical protein HY984_01370 [Candidatus Magasanikbacteria bacterium]|nr:hypothetical protein [Candidatus Magasanikbacteria bacterium]
MITNPITKIELDSVAIEHFGDMVKAVVDVKKKIMAIGGDLHADEEKLLLEKDSVQPNLWGINIYPNASTDQRIEFDSMINLRPRQNNRSRSVEDALIRQQIIDVVNGLISW